MLGQETSSSVVKKIIKNGDLFSIQYGDQHRDLDLNNTQKLVLDILIKNREQHLSMKSLAGSMSHETFKKAKNFIIAEMCRKIGTVKKTDFIISLTGKNGWIGIDNDVEVLES